MFSIPDALGRVVLTGTCTNSMNYAADPLGNNVVKVARNNTNGTYKGYATPTGVVLSSPVIMSVNYYDDYTFMGTNGIPAATDTNFKCEIFWVMEHSIRVGIRVRLRLLNTLTIKNGAMNKDLNKSISAVSCNLLNLPSQVMIGGVTHKYTLRNI